MFFTKKTGSNDPVFLFKERLIKAQWGRARSAASRSSLAPLEPPSVSKGFNQRFLKWADVDFAAETITLRGANNKAGNTVHLPINSVVMQTLRSWQEQKQAGKNSLYVFPSPVTGEKLDNVNKSWASVLKDAEIKNFRWHDMRHDFASQLVMKGVDLNTVRELMGHSDMKMTMRYAHLAPSSQLRAVELLVENAL